MKRQILLTRQTNGEEQIDCIARTYPGTVFRFGCGFCQTSENTGSIHSIPYQEMNHIEHIEDGEFYDIDLSGLCASGSSKNEDNFLRSFINRFSSSSTLFLFDHVLPAAPAFFSTLLLYHHCLHADMVFFQNELNEFYPIFDNVDIFSDRQGLYSWDIVSDTDKLVLFDWYGVAEGVPSRSCKPTVRYINGMSAVLSRLGSSCHFHKQDLVGISQRLTKCLLDETQTDVRTSSSRTDLIKWYERLSKEFGFADNVTYQTFEEIYREEMQKATWNPSIVKIASRIRNRCLTGIFSNLTLLDALHIDQSMHLGDFQYTWLSFETGKAKPDTCAYAQVEYDCLVAPSRILFIDDTLENIRAADARGWQTFLYCGVSRGFLEHCIESFLTEDACSVRMIPATKCVKDKPQADTLYDIRPL